MSINKDDMIRIHQQTDEYLRLMNTVETVDRMIKNVSNGSYKLDISAYHHETVDILLQNIMTECLERMTILMKNVEDISLKSAKNDRSGDDSVS